jgi:hypothetical protein
MINYVCWRPDENHALSQTHGRDRGDLGSNAVVCAFSTVKDVSITGFGPADALTVGLDRDMGSVL